MNYIPRIATKNEVLTTTSFNILAGFGGIAGARWWLVGAEDGMTRAVDQMLHTRAIGSDSDWRRFAHIRLRRARQELRKAQAEFQAMMADRELEYQTRSDARLLVGE